MGEDERAHWSITPETVFLNNYQNYFLYDSYFVLGSDVSSNFVSTLEVFSKGRETLSLYLKK